MKNSRTWLIWGALGICAGMILAAMAWQTRNVLRAEQERTAAEARATLQENMRLALWRMDTTGASMLATELSDESLEEVHARFDWRESNEVEVRGNPPGDETKCLADLRRAVSVEGISFKKIYHQLKDKNDVWKSTQPPEATKRSETSQAPDTRAGYTAKSAQDSDLSQRNSAVEKQLMTQTSVMEKSAYRQKSAAPLASEPAAAKITKNSPAASVPLGDGKPAVLAGTLRPVWVGEELFLLRPAISLRHGISGTWLDLAALKSKLLDQARDLLPSARLTPAKAPSADGLVLASFPLRLEAGLLPVGSFSPSRPLVTSLIAGWAAALVAIFAALFLVLGIMRLSERRASFVSAVTHELRTPLTTFRLYSDMLESNAVKPENRGTYLRVLSREADRLTHLVENVLAFSRIERGSARATLRTAKLAHLLEPFRERFENRLASGGMTLLMDLENATAKCLVKTDAAACEHILFNLVDNAAKYATGGASPTLKISVRHSGETTKKMRHFAEIHVVDQGPGIPAPERRRIFRAFHKSAHEAAESCPGVGLGLALSRRLAHSLGGNLICVAEKSGAHFILSLPIDRCDKPG